MDHFSRGGKKRLRARSASRRTAFHAHGQGRQLRVEQLEARQLLALTHLYTFNDGLANDWIGNAHATLFNGATVTGGQLVLANAGVTSGQTSVVRYARLPAGVLPAAGSFTIEAWFTTNAAENWSRVFDIGDQSGANGNSYVFFSPQTGSDDSRSVIRAGGIDEVVATAPTTDDGQQHMAAIVVDTAADLLRLYIDGVETTTAPLAGVTAGSVNDALAYLGRSLFNADPGFTGSINEVRIYDEARTAADVLQDSTAGPSTATKSPQIRQMEYLDRGVVAIRRSTNEIYIGWRLLGTDPANITFNVYRSANGGAPVKLNANPIAATTDFVDTTFTIAQTNVYTVRPVVDGVELEPSESFTVAANLAVGYYKEVPLQVPAGGTTPSGENYTYSANDASVGDVDGDGQYEIILKWEPSNAKDNSQSGYTGNVYMDAYKLDGTRLWRIDLGKNIRAGAHYTQFIVYDFDGDGRAEVAMKTAPGTIDGLGNPVLLGNDSATADYRNTSGYILTGPEYLTVFNGLTGANMVTIPFTPARVNVNQWGDNYGNRVDRFTAGVAYLDGERPSLIMARGYYGPQSGFSARNEIAAYDFRDGQLTQRWLFRAAVGINGNINSNYIGQGTHSLSIADVDNDGKDEIIYGNSVIDDTGLGLYSTGLGHGDALHVSDMDPLRPGLEVFMPHETTSIGAHIGSSLRDARTGQLIAGPTVTQNTDGSWPDVGRGVAMDIDPNHLGYEFWDSYHPSIYDVHGNAIYGKGNAFTNFAVWWDADPLRELLDGTTISDWNYAAATPGRSNYDLNPNQAGVQSAPGVTQNNGTKSNPALSADIFGDWREEVIWRTTSSNALRIFTTPIAATSRMVTLMHDSQYREAIAWQNGAYNQPPHPSFFLGAGMTTPPPPQMSVVINGDFNGDRRVDGGDLAVWATNSGQATQANHAAGDADGDRDVDGSDFLAWQRNLGAAAPPVAPPPPPETAEALLVPADDASTAIRDELFARLAGAFVQPDAARPAAYRPAPRPVELAPASATAESDDDAAVPAAARQSPRHADAGEAEELLALAVELSDAL